ncbi:MAG: hypothetical protein Q8Q40_03705 [Methylococcaceae bacterium]|nr:hypothetical protein [Methylococcaceae bacterium]MDP3903063.1 hypothetical protein [Methylococcaceae bacterium]
MVLTQLAILEMPKGIGLLHQKKNIVIKQDELPIYIRCENNKQWGASQANLIIENTVQFIARSPGGPITDQAFPNRYCFLFCDVFDFVNDSQYKYPRYVYLEMNNR